MRRSPKLNSLNTANIRNILLGSVIIGFLSMAFDLAFHACCTSPMETPAYFLAKWLWGSVSALVGFAIPSIILGAFVGGIVFDILVGIYYYAAYLSQNPYLSCCTIYPPQVFGVQNIAYFNFGYPISFGVLAFIVAHFFVFFLAFLAVTFIQFGGFAFGSTRR